MDTINANRVEKARKVRMDDGCDAGEFLNQNFSRAAKEEGRAASEWLCDGAKDSEKDPTELAAIMTEAGLMATLSGINDYGMEFESMDGEEDMSLAMKGCDSATRFVCAALTIKRNS